MVRQNNRILKPYVILCEGIDDQNFLIEYLNSNELSSDQRFSQDIQVFRVDGIYNLPTYLENFRKYDGFSSVRRLMVIRDADENVQNSAGMVQAALRKSGFNVPERCNQWTDNSDSVSTGYTLMPSCSSESVPGAIEDLCWSILIDDNDQMREDIKQFVTGIRNRYHTIHAHENKSRLHTYFSVNENLISMKIGEAAKAGAFNWQSERLNALHEFITAGFIEDGRESL